MLDLLLLFIIVFIAVDAEDGRGERGGRTVVGIHKIRVRVRVRVCGRGWRTGSFVHAGRLDGPGPNLSFSPYDLTRLNFFGRACYCFFRHQARENTR